MGFNDEGLGEAVRQSAAEDATKQLETRLAAAELQIRIVDAAQNVMLDQMQALGKVLLDVIAKQNDGAK